MKKEIQFRMPSAIMVAHHHLWRQHIVHLMYVRGVLNPTTFYIDDKPNTLEVEITAQGTTDPLPGWDADGRPVEEWPQ